MRVSTRYAIGGLVGIALVAVALMGLSHSASKPVANAAALPGKLVRAHAPKRATVPLQVRWFGPGKLFSAHVMIDVRVGNGPKVPVLLDTGSEGLHIYDLGVKLGSGGGVSTTSTPDSVHFADGSIQTGVVARAKLTIGSVRTREAVPFGLIQNIQCDAEHSICPATVGMKYDATHGEYGVLGIELWQEPGGLANPLLALPAPYSHGWSLSLGQNRGKLVLNAPTPAHPAANFHLKRDGKDPSGARAWSDRSLKVCWAYSGMRGAACEPSLFDSGNTVGAFLFGGALSHAPTLSGTDMVEPGTFIAAWQPGSQQPFWSFTAGQRLSRNMVGVSPGKLFATTSNLPFFHRTFTYDAVRGRMLISGN
jgi:hypothetical protein